MTFEAGKARERNPILKIESREKKSDEKEKGGKPANQRYLQHINISPLRSCLGRLKF